MKQKGVTDLPDVSSDSQPRGYDSGKGLSEISTELSLDKYQIAKLNANENLFIPLNFLRQLMIGTARELDPRYYGIDEAALFKRKLAERESVPTEMLSIGAGADQLIDLLVQGFAGRDDRVISIEPTFSMYRVSALRNGIPYQGVSLCQEFQLDMDSFLGEIDSATGLCFICSPNNPTANQFSVRDIRSVCRTFNGKVIIDETYVDFAEFSVRDLLEDEPNMVILRSFSKAWGIAGLRLGYLLAAPEICNELNSRYQLPYPASAFAMMMGTKLLGLSKYVAIITNAIKTERARLFERLNRIDGVRAFPSKTNFILFSVDRSSLDVQTELMRKGILVRKLGSVGQQENCLRVTVPPRDLADRFIAVLEGIM